MKQTIEIEVPEGKKAVWKDNKVVFEDIESPLSKTWEEFCNTCDIKEVKYTRKPEEDKNVLPSKKAEKQHLALMKLHLLRDCYRQGWEPDWYNLTKEKYCIIRFNCGYMVEHDETARHFLTFQSEEIADKFLNNFRDLIIQAGDLI